MNRSFAIRLREVRQRAGFTQQQAAMATGYCRSSIQKFERGVRIPPPRSQKPILDALKK